MTSLPRYVPRDLVVERLPLIFPEGTPNRNYCVRQLAASTIFTALYIGAVAGSHRFLAPKHVYRMTDEQAAMPETEAREEYFSRAMSSGFEAPGARWYADNTREPIRDETLREGLVAVGAVVAREDLPTTSSRPRYALTPSFAALFAPSLTGKSLERAIARWQTANLSTGALARVSILRRGAAGGVSRVLVTFPSRETRLLAPGPSSFIARAVIEVFAPRFLERPAVLWLSESGNKTVARDDELAAAIGLEIRANRELPDLILVDLGPPEPLLIFVEVVATDGAITPRRQRALHGIADAAGFRRSRIAFVTAYQDRESSGFRKTASGLAWGSFAWFASEPENIIILRSGVASLSRLSELI
jgi:hypothetical protein